MAEAILVEGLSKRFGEFVAVNDISFRISQGEVFGFLGPNGAGKTTTIRMLCGILPPTSGKAFIQGVDILQEPGRIKGIIGYMSQRFSLYTDLTVEENLSLYGGIYDLPRDRFRGRYQEVLEVIGLKGKEGMMVEELPTGWRQRLALGCAILHHPQVLFLDEPTSGVDPTARQAFWELIYHLSSQGTTVLVTTHYMEEAEQCHRVGMIFQGRLVALDTPSALKEKLPARVYEVDTERPLGGAQVLRQLPGVVEVTPWGGVCTSSLRPMAPMGRIWRPSFGVRGSSFRGGGRSPLVWRTAFSISLRGRKVRGQVLYCREGSSSW